MTTRAVGRHVDDAGRYELAEQIGRGAMGEVYRARDTALMRDVAIKRLPEDFAGDERRLARLLREGRVLAALNHPQIATLHDITELDGRPALVMELVDGETLHDRIRVAGRLPIAEALSVAVQIAAALEAAHARGVVHCDLKPANVKLRADGQVKVLDFGLALLGEPLDGDDVDTASTMSSASAGRLRGTPAYLSPERVAGEPPDAQGDVWALGCVLYEMLTGRRAFGYDSLANTLQAIGDARPDLAVLPAGTPPVVHALLRRCLHRDRRARFATMHDARVLLEDAWRAARVLAGRPRPFWRAAAVAAAVFGLASLGVWSWSRVERAVPVRTLGIMPFESRTGDRGDEELAAGLTEALMNEIVRLRGLDRVVGPPSMGRYLRESLRKAASEVDVQAIIAGHVSRVSGRLRIAVRLVDGRSEAVLWSETYDRNPADARRIEHEIVRTVAREIGVTLSPADERRLSGRARSIEPAAYEAYLRGRAALRVFRNVEALRHFERAVERDDSFADAWADLAGALIWQGYFQPPEEIVPRARAAAERALTLDPDSAVARLALGRVRMQGDWDWDGAGREFDRALGLSPNSSDVRWQRGVYLMVVGRTEEGIAEARQARRLEPLSPFATFQVAFALRGARRFAEALEQMDAALALEPESVSLTFQRGITRILTGDIAGARIDLLGRSEFSPDVIGNRSTGSRFVDAFVAYLLARSGESKAAQAMARQLEQQYAQHTPAIRGGYPDPFLIALVYAGLEQSDRAFFWLEEATRRRSFYIAQISIEPFFDALRSDPRFDQVLRRMNYPG